MRSKHKLITTVAASTQKRLEYAFEGSIFIGGAVVQWLRDNLKLIGASSDVEALAASVPIRAEWCLCLRLLAWARRTGTRMRPAC